ncbi:MAG: competence protein CoiA family protein, partial [Kosmotogaceae bacterium]
MSDVKIKFGVDQQDRFVHIEEAEHVQFIYRCPECDAPLIVREGDVRTKHFAHSSDDTHRDCSLRTESNYDEWEKNNIKTSPVEKHEKNRRLRIIIIKHPYRNRYELRAILPTTSFEDFNSYGREEIRSLLDDIEITGECIKGMVAPQDFHPSESEVRVPIDPNSDSYEIEVKSAMELSSISGIWKADNIEIFDCFVGDEKRAERTQDQMRLRKNDIIYVVCNELDSVPSQFQVFELNDYYLLTFEIDTDTLVEARKILGTDLLHIDKHAFQVNIILPPELPPKPEGPIVGEANSLVMVSITPLTPPRV